TLPAMRLTAFALTLLLSIIAACGPAAPVVSPKPLASASPSASASTVADPSDPPLPLDARVRKGTLANGLTYYVLPHKKPEKRAQVWLAVNAGSVLED